MTADTDIIEQEQKLAETMGFPNKEDYDPPRYLTEEELDRLVDYLPPTIAALDDVADTVRAEIQNKLKMQIRDLMVCPQVLMKFMGLMVNQFVRSVIPAGQPVGANTGESIGQPMTQMTLNTFHQTGSAKAMSMGIDAFKELFNASKNRKHINTTIHFKDKNMSFDEVLETRRELIGITVKDLLISHEYFPSIEDDVEVPLINRGWWYPMFLAIYRRQFVDSVHYLRLQLNTTLMYTYKITLDDVCKALEGNEPQVLTCIPGLDSEGIIDVYPDEKVMRQSLIDKLKTAHASGITDENASLLFMQQTTLPLLGKIIVKGIPNITQLFPIQTTTWSAILSEQPYLWKEQLNDFIDNYRLSGKSTQEQADMYEFMKGRWRLHLDLIKMRISGIGLSKIRSVLDLCGITVEEAPADREMGEVPAPNENKYQIVVSMPKNWEQTPGLLTEAQIEKKIRPLPGHYVAYLIKQDEDRIEADVKRRQKELETKIAEEKKQGIPEDQRTPLTSISGVPTQLMRAGTYVYAEVNGLNLSAILSHPLVDVKRTISNSPHEINEVLGIESCRNFLAKEFYDIITGNSSYVNARYVALIPDFMTTLGTIAPITSRGVARQHRGAFADASFEHSVDVFIRAAMAGRWEEVISTSACIFLGKRAPLGTGAMYMGLNEDVIAEIDAAARAAELASQPTVVSLEAAQADADAIGDELQFAGDHLQYSEAVSQSDVFFTPDPNGPQPSATVQSSLKPPDSKAQAKVEPVIPILASLLAPKGPIPPIQPVGVEIPEWIAGLLAAIPRSNLPSLRGLNFTSLSGSLPIITEQQPGQIDLSDFLSD